MMNTISLGQNHVPDAVCFDTPTSGIPHTEAGHPRRRIRTSSTATLRRQQVFGDALTENNVGCIPEIDGDDNAAVGFG